MESSLQATQDTSLIHSYQRAVILNAIRKYGSVSRTALGERVGIRQASITEIVRELVEEGFIIEAGSEEGAARGRKQILLRLNARKGFVVGVEFDASGVRAVALDLEGQMISQSRRVLQEPVGKSSLLPQLMETTRELVEEVKNQNSILLGIGLADPGVVNSKTGMSLISSTVKDWREVPLKKLFQEAFGVEVSLEETTRTRTWYEKQFGRGKDVSNLIYVEFGTGIGCGIILENRIFRGASDSAGELGHMRVMDNGPVCNCGNTGCLEAVASLPAIALRAKKGISEGANSLIFELAGRNLEVITADHVFEGARRGDKLALGIIDEIVKYLGIGIANVVNLFNPEMVIFGDRMSGVADVLFEPLVRMIKRQALDVSARNLICQISHVPQEAGALGAGYQMVDRFFAIPQFKKPDFL